MEERKKPVPSITRDTRGFIHVNGVKTGVRLVNGGLEFANKDKRSRARRGRDGERVALADFVAAIKQISDG